MDLEKCDVCGKEIKTGEKFAAIFIQLIKYNAHLTLLEQPESKKLYDLCKFCYDKMANKIHKLIIEIQKEYAEIG